MSDIVELLEKLIRGFGDEDDGEALATIVDENARPNCGEEKPEGHAPDCALYAAVRE